MLARMLARCSLLLVIAIEEGSSGERLAAALTGKAGHGPIVAIVSGGNIDLEKFSELIA